jgi:small subunit ribosomal protein S1
VRDGRVVNLADFGAFVDIGGMEGLVHLSELSWKRVNNPSEVLELGDKVKVSILNIDHERQRLALSIKRLQPDPWTMLEDQYHVGQLVEATITKLTKFGAFARLQDQYELIGLIHISELSEEHVVHPRDVVTPSQTVMVRIIRIDPEQRQLGLSLKQVSSDRFLESDLEMLAAS